MTNVLMRLIVAGTFAGFSVTSSLSQPQQPRAGEAPTTATAQIRLDIKDAPPLAPLQGTIKGYVIKDESQMTPGSLADAFFGDFVLENDVMRAVIGRPDKKRVSAAGGGNLVDILRTNAPMDYINYVNTAGDLRTTASHVAYTDAIGPVQEGTTATVTLTGTATVSAQDTQLPENVDVVTTYALGSNQDHLLISTLFINNTTSVVELLPGDVIDWGHATGFLEGVGISRDGADQDASFCLGFADDAVIGYVTSGSLPMKGIHRIRDSLVMAWGEPGMLKIEQPPGTETPYSPGRSAGDIMTTSSGDITTTATAGTTTAGMLLQPGGTAPPYSPGGGAIDTITTSSGDITTTATARATTAGLLLQPGGTFTFERYLVMSDGDFSRVAAFAYQVKNIPIGKVAGAVLERGTDQPIADAEVYVSGGGSWNNQGMAPAFYKAKTRADGTFSLPLPEGSYTISAAKVGRQPASAAFPVTVKAGQQPQLLAIPMSTESIVRVGVFDGDSRTSSPLPCKVTLVNKPGTGPINWGFRPDVAKGVRNAFFLPYGAAIMPVTPGRYQVVISRGLEYDIVKKDISVTAGTDQLVTASLRNVLKPHLKGLIAMDAGLVTTASAVGAATARTRVIQAACEGVPVIVSGDYRQVTDLQAQVTSAGLEKWVRAFNGMRFLLNQKDLTADVFAYPLTEQTAAKLRTALDTVAGLPPDIALADIRKAVPEVLLEISRPTDPEKGYLSSFPFDDANSQFTEGIPPADFDAIQIVEGKKVGAETINYPRYAALQISRYSPNSQKISPLSPTGSSFSRLPYGEEVGYPRTYLYTSLDTVQGITEAEIISKIRGQHFTVSNGLIMRLAAEQLPAGSPSKGPGEVVDLSTTRILRLKPRVLAAPWVSLSSLYSRDNGLVGVSVPVMRPHENVIRYPLNPDAEQVFTRYPEEDVFVDAHAFGTGRSLAPVVPDAPIDFGGPVFPYSWTGPTFVDKQGDGKIELKKLDMMKPRQ